MSSPTIVERLRARRRFHEAAGGDDGGHWIEDDAADLIEALMACYIKSQKPSLCGVCFYREGTHKDRCPVIHVRTLLSTGDCGNE